MLDVFREDLGMATINFRTIFSSPPRSGGEGQGEGDVVAARTRKERSGRLHQRMNAKRLRTHQTDAERVFWYNVRAHRLAGFKFKRQYPVGPYIADFVCLEARLIVELDGGPHASQQDYDERRDAYLKSKGFQVLRVWNMDLLTNRDGVLETVLRKLRNVDAPSP